MAIYIQPATAEHVDAICDIMRECVEALERPEFFVDDEREEMARRADGDEGFILLARCGADIAGFLMIDIPGVAERNLGRDLGWPEEWLDSAAHIDTACVRPAHRGLGLQKKLVAEAEARLRDMGIVRYLATIHPENVASLASMRALGYEIGVTKEKYGGLVRHVLYKVALCGDNSDFGSGKDFLNE